MKFSFKHIFVLTCACFALVSHGLATPPIAISVSPSAINNTYAGRLILDMTGLTNTEKVIVQKWLDSNGNGLVDAGELLFDSFNITDGGAMIINGVTNLNVPFDRNPSGGAITTTLNCPPALALENMVGNYVFRMVSPTGRFVPVTTTLTITNAVLNQSVSGVIYSNGVPAPYAVAVVQDLQQNNPAGSAVADASGHYLIKLVPGTYGLIGSAPNCYFNQGAAPVVTLTNDMTATNDLYLTNGTVAISGKVYDSASSNGIAGTLLLVQSGPFFAVAFTDTNGFYSAAVAPGFWKIKPSKERLARRAYVVSQSTFQVDATGGSVSNADIALPKGNALFYGRITDNSNVPFANVEVDGGMANNQYDAKGFSDTNGYYTVAILGDATNYWTCDVNSGKGGSLNNYIVNYTGSVIVPSNQVSLQNFIALPTIGQISGQVRDNFGNPVAGVGLNADNGSQYHSLDGVTDNLGNYSLSVAAGQWNVQFFTGGGQDNLDAHGFVDLGTHLVSVPPTNVVLNLTVYPLGTPVINQAARYSPTQFGFNISGSVGVTYTVQISTNLASTNWFNLSSFQLTSNYFPITDTHATNGARYYRVLKN